MELISISGLDGSGKSTQINLIKEYLESQGQRAFYFHAGKFSIANKFLRTKKDSAGREVSISQAGWLGIFLRKVALYIDLFRFKLLRNKLRNKNYVYILSDRYFYDTVLNIEYLASTCHPKPTSGSMPKADSDSETRETLGHFMSKWIVKPTLAIYLNTDPEKIMSRERKPDQGMEYLRKKKDLYDHYADSLGMKTIEGSRKKEEIFEEIKHLL